MSNYLASDKGRKQSRVNKLNSNTTVKTYQCNCIPFRCNYLMYYLVALVLSNKFSEIKLAYSIIY